MRNIFTKTFALLTMAAMSMGVWAGDFYGSNYNQKATVPGTIDLSYGSYTGWNRNSFFSNASKMEYSQKDAVAQFTFTVSDASAFLFSLQASNGNPNGDYNCDLQVKIWSTSAEEPASPNTTFTVEDDDNWLNFVTFNYETAQLPADDYYLKITWTDQANVQNIKFYSVITPSAANIDLTTHDKKYAYQFGQSRDKDHDPLTYMSNGDYVEYYVNIASSDDYIVSFISSFNEENAQISVSMTKFATSEVTTKSVSILNRGWDNDTRYVAIFPNVEAGAYLMRITLSTGAPNLGKIKLMSTADYTYTIGGSEVNLSTDWKTKALIEISDSRYKEHDNVEYTGNNDNLNFILYNLYSSPLDLSFEASTDKDNASIVVELLNENGAILSSETKNITKAGWDTWADYSTTDINTTAGYQVLRLRFENNGSNVRNIKVTPKVYLRTHPHMNLNTLCFPYQIDTYEGATFYTILNTEVEAGELTKLVLEEHEGALEAGVPYFYDPSGTELVCYYSGDAASEGTAANDAFVGKFADNSPVPAGSYVTVNNQLYKCGSGVTMGEYRAYVTATTYTRAAVPGRRRLTIGGNNAPTDVESILPSEISSQKIFRNGQIVIVKGDKMYNVMGQEL